MGFTTDKQTIDDLNIFGRRGADSIFTIFNHTHTIGGAEVLEQMFQYPLSDGESINERSGIIQYFGSINVDFPFQSALFDSAQHYLENTDNRSRLMQEQNTFGRKFKNVIGSDIEYQLIYKGVTSIKEIFHNLNDFIKSIKDTSHNTPYRSSVDEISHMISDTELGVLLQGKRSGKLSFTQVAECDKVLRYIARDKVKKLLYYIYYLDVYISVAKVASNRKFVFPKALEKNERCVKLEDVYHPLVPGAVPNTLSITPDSNVVFLTGANMAGKSTFMKTLGIAMYLAHMGFPVPARQMEFSVRDGVYTTINLPDNLNMGYSHFYTEVVRVKKMAEEVSKSKYLFIIFDELFRGTNVKDAYEATIAITGAFAQKPNCIFIVSTHIIEAGDVLKEQYDNINFIYLPTLMEVNTPVYPYKIESGITADRHGMIIINNEGIIDIIKSRKKQIL